MSILLKHYTTCIYTPKITQALDSALYSPECPLLLTRLRLGLPLLLLLVLSPCQGTLQLSLRVVLWPHPEISLCSTNVALPLLPTGNPAYQTSPGAGAFPRKFEPPRVPRAICTCHFWIFWLFSFHFTPDTSLMKFGSRSLGPVRRTSFTNSAWKGTASGLQHRPWPHYRSGPMNFFTAKTRPKRPVASTTFTGPTPLCWYSTGYAVCRFASPHCFSWIELASATQQLRYSHLLLWLKFLWSFRLKVSALRPHKPWTWQWDWKSCVLRLLVAAVTQRHLAAGDGSNECIALENSGSQASFCSVTSGLFWSTSREPKIGSRSKVHQLIPSLSISQDPYGWSEVSKSKQNIAKRCKTWHRILTSIPCSLSLSLFHLIASWHWHD